MIVPSPDSTYSRNAAERQDRHALSAAEQSRRLTQGRVWRVAMALLSAVIIGVIWYLLINTGVGQALDSVSMLGSYRYAWIFGGLDRSVLSAVSVNALVAVMVVAAVIAIARRRWMLGLRAAVMVAGSMLTTQALKAYVFGRPLLIPSAQTANSFPSGHTTAAAAAAAALVLVVPLAWRSTAAVIGVVLTALMGLSTVVNHWHRPADVIAAIIVVFAWAILLAPKEKTRKRDAFSSGFLIGVGYTLLFIAIASLGLSAWMLTDSMANGLVLKSQAGLENLAGPQSLIGMLSALGGLAGIVGTSAFTLGQLDNFALR